MTQDFMPNGDLAITFKDGTKAILMYSEAVPASPFFATKVKETGFTAESKAGSVACWVVLLKNGKKAVLQFFGKAKEQANMLALSPEYSSDKLKSFLNSLNLAKLVRDNGTFIVVLCLPKDVEFPKVVIKPERDKSFEPCYF